MLKGEWIFQSSNRKRCTYARCYSVVPDNLPLHVLLQMGPVPTEILPTLMLDQKAQGAAPHNTTIPTWPVSPATDSSDSSDYLWMKYARNNDLKKRRNNTHGTWFLKNHLRKHSNFPSIACCKECTCNGLNAKLALLKWFPGILLILKDTISGHLFEGFSPFLNHQD